jgi:hypothetical protein
MSALRVHQDHLPLHSKARAAMQCFPQLYDIIGLQYFFSDGTWRALNKSLDSSKQGWRFSRFTIWNHKPGCSLDCCGLAVPVSYFLLNLRLSRPCETPVLQQDYLPAAPCTPAMPWPLPTVAGLHIPFQRAVGSG